MFYLNRPHKLRVVVRAMFQPGRYTRRTYWLGRSRQIRTFFRYCTRIRRDATHEGSRCPGRRRKRGADRLAFPELRHHGLSHCVDLLWINRRHAKRIPIVR